MRVVARGRLSETAPCSKPTFIFRGIYAIQALEQYSVEKKLCERIVANLAGD